jgi:hypothetical protein
VHRGEVHPESGKQGLPSQGQGQKEKHPPALQHAESEPDPDMVLFVVADFVGENPRQLRNGLLLNQRVKKGDALVFPEPREKSVGLGGPARPVDHEQVVRG